MYISESVIKLKIEQSVFGNITLLHGPLTQFYNLNDVSRLGVKNEASFMPEPHIF